MVLFILFPGFNLSEKCWSSYYDKHKNKIIKTNFLQYLKKIGKVFVFTPNGTNVIKYYDSNNIEKRLYKKPNKLSLNDIDIKYQCELIYSKIKKYDEKIIPIGHSVGAWFAIYFTKLYKSKCIKTILIDGSAIHPTIYNDPFHTQYFKKHNKITNDDLNNIFLNIVNNKKRKYNINKLIDIIWYNYYINIKKELNGKLENETLSIIDLRMDDFVFDTKKVDLRSIYKIKDQKLLYNNNKKKAKVYYVVNASHTPWFNKHICNEMIRQIKYFIKY